MIIVKDNKKKQPARKISICLTIIASYTSPPKFALHDVLHSPLILL